MRRPDTTLETRKQDRIFQGAEKVYYLQSSQCFYWQQKVDLQEVGFYHTTFHNILKKQGPLQSFSKNLDSKIIIINIEKLN